MTSFIMRVQWKEAGAHVHAQIFTGREGGTLGKAGDLTFRTEEFRAWKDGSMVTDRIDGQIVVEFREEKP
jgi:hypothetical protein